MHWVVFYIYTQLKWWNPQLVSNPSITYTYTHVHSRTHAPIRAHSTIKARTTTTKNTTAMKFCEFLYISGQPIGIQQQRIYADIKFKIADTPLDKVTEKANRSTQWLKKKLICSSSAYFCDCWCVHLRSRCKYLILISFYYFFFWKQQQQSDCKRNKVV